jgi:streptogramin lyase
VFIATGVLLGGSIIAGVFAALQAGDDEEALDSVGGAPQAVQAHPRAEGRNADPAIEFPAKLSDFAESPHDIAITSDGSVWFLIQAPGSATFPLYRYDPRLDATEVFELPTTEVTGFFQEIEADARGHLVLGYGYLIVDFDPVTRTFAKFELPVPAALEGKFNIPDRGTYVTDLAVTESGTVYISRWNTASVAELDLTTGKITELPLPPSFGFVWDIELAEGELWITDPAGVDEEHPPQTGRLNISTGKFTAIDANAFSMAYDGSERIFAATWEPQGLVEIKESGSTNPRVVPVMPLASQQSSGLAANELVLVDANSGYLWATKNGPRGTIDRLSLKDGALRRLGLPSIFTSDYSCPPSAEGTDPCGSSPVEVLTVPADMALAPNGDLWFIDGQGSGRIGVVHADR